MVVANNNYTDLQIVLTPNRSASWRFNCALLKCFGLVIFGIAIGWSLMGVWIILPFAGLEFALLVFFVYRTSKDCHRKEVLHLDEASVCLERGEKFPTSCLQYDRSACEFIKQNPQHPWTAATISLRCRDQKVRIGRFLNRQDINTLWDTLRRSGFRVREEGRVQIKDTNPLGL